MFFLTIFPWLARLGPFITLLKGRWKLASLALTAVAMIGTYLWIASLNNRLSAAEGNLILAQDQLLTCQMTNDSNMGTIVSLTDANDSLASLIRVSHADQRMAEIEARERASQAASELTETLQELGALRDANPTCAQISSIDLGAACPVIVQRLHESAAAANSQD